MNLKAYVWRTGHVAPEGHTTGRSFNTVPDGWEPNSQAVANDCDRWDDDIPTNDVNNDRTGGAAPSDAEHIFSVGEWGASIRGGRTRRRESCM